MLLVRIDIFHEIMSYFHYLVLVLFSDRLASHFHMAVSLLNEGHSNVMLKDHNVVADRIKRRLVREKRIDDAARFSSLMNRLLKSVSCVLYP